ncbi:MAG: Nif3-like dinuclear metal center hexameric protein [Candidatus Bipolaricaulaceae bacterium]
MQRADVVSVLDAHFPPALAEEWDRSGLQVGPLGAACRRVVVALDLTTELAAHLDGVDLVVTHHPLLFRALQVVQPETPTGGKLAALLAAGAACYAVHTPYDVARGGLGEVLADLLGLQNPRPLAPRGRAMKLVTFVPPAHVEQVAAALFAAGAGEVGRYGSCSFRAPGRGTFLPKAGARPFLGEVGTEQQVDEVRLETVVPAEAAAQAIAALQGAHPYEEVAFDLYRLENDISLHGLGRVGDLLEPAAAGAVVEEFARRLGAAQPARCWGKLERPVRRVAVCGGSGGGLWQEALDAGAQLLITGEIGYHLGQQAAEHGLAVAALGHAETERPFVAHLVDLLSRQLPGLEVVGA